MNLSTCSCKKVTSTSTQINPFYHSSNTHNVTFTEISSTPSSSTSPQTTLITFHTPCPTKVCNAPTTTAPVSSSISTIFPQYLARHYHRPMASSSHSSPGLSMLIPTHMGNHDNAVEAIAISLPKGPVLATADTGQVSVRWIQSHSIQVHQLPGDPITARSAMSLSISRIGNRAVTLEPDHTVTCWRLSTQSQRKVETIRKDAFDAIECKISPDGTKLFVLFCPNNSSNCPNAVISCYDWARNSDHVTIQKHHHLDGIAYVCSVSFQQQLVVLPALTDFHTSSPTRRRVIVANTATGQQLKSFDLNNGPSPADIAIAQNVPVAVFAQNNTLRVFHAIAQDNRDFTLSGYSAPNSPFPVIAISSYGTFVAAGLSQTSIGVWNVSTRSLCAYAPGQGSNVRSLAFDSTTTSLVAGYEDGAVCLFSLPTKFGMSRGSGPMFTSYSTAISLSNAQAESSIRRRFPGLSSSVSRSVIPTPPTAVTLKPATPMLAALSTVLNAPPSTAPSVLSQTFLVNTLVPKNVTTPIDLLAGHNLLLLALRRGVITRSSISQLGGTAYAVELALYGSAKRFPNDADTPLVHAVLLHAERVGIIRSGATHAAIRQLAGETASLARSMENAIVQLSEQVILVDKNVRSLGSTVVGLKSELDEFAREVVQFGQAVNQRIDSAEKNVRTLADNINVLHKKVTVVGAKQRRQEKTELYCGIAKAVLAIIPLGALLSPLVDPLANVAMQALNGGVGTLLRSSLGDVIPSALGDMVPTSVNVPETLVNDGMSGLTEPMVGAMVALDLTSPMTLKRLLDEDVVDALPPHAKRSLNAAVNASQFGSLSAFRKAISEHCTLALTGRGEHCGEVEIEKLALGLSNVNICTPSIEEQDLARALFRAKKDPQLPFDHAIELLQAVLKELGLKALDEDMIFRVMRSHSGADGDLLTVTEDEFLQATRDACGRTSKFFDVEALQQGWRKQFASHAKERDGERCLLVVGVGALLIAEIYNTYGEGETMSEDEAMGFIRRVLPERSNRMREEEFVRVAQKAVETARSKNQADAQRSVPEERGLST